MLYDPKWEQKTKMPSMAGLVAWLETQPPSQKYDYNNCIGACLLGQYLNAIGLRWDEELGPGFEVWNKNLWRGPLGGVSVGRPRTFGGALERARAALYTEQQYWKLTTHMRQTKQPKFREAPRPSTPPLLVWRDTTSYTRDKERIATSWTMTLQPGCSVTVTKGHIYYPGQWVLHCEPWFNTRPLEAESEERAKAIAIDLIAQKIDSIGRAILSLTTEQQ